MDKNEEEFGEILFYLDPVSKEVIYAIDGEDNINYYSYQAVRKEGLLAHPEHLNHEDIWFTQNFTLPQVKGFINLRNASEEGFECKEYDIKEKFELWKQHIVAGSISKDNKKINIISSKLLTSETRQVINFFIKNHLINDQSMVSWNNVPQNHAGKFFVIKPKPEMLLATKLVQGQPVPEIPSHSAPQVSLTDSVPSEIANKPAAEVAPQAPVINPGQSREDPEVLALIEKYKAGDSDAADQLYMKYEKLIRGVVNSYLRRYGKETIKGNDVDNPNYDLFQEAVVKFLERLKDYDSTKGRLSTFIQINSEGVARHILSRPPGRTNITEFDQDPRLKRVLDEYQNGDKSYEQIGSELGIPPEEVKELINKAISLEGKERGLEVNIQNKPSSPTYENNDIEDVGQPDFDKMSPPEQKNTDMDEFNKVINEFEMQDPKLGKVLKEYFYNNKTYQQIGDEIGVSKEYIRQIIEKALEKLRTNPAMQAFSRKIEAIKLDIIFNNKKEIMLATKND